MGNDITLYQNRMSAENWEFLLTMMIKTTEKLLTRKKVDKAVASAVTASREPGVDIYQANTAGKIVARIRPFSTDKGTSKPGDPVSMTMKFGTGQIKAGTIPLGLLESLPNWEAQDIKNTRDLLIEMRADSKRLYDMNCSFKEKRKEDIFPPKPQPGKKYGDCADWTAFGFCPTSKRKAKRFIDKLAAHFESTRVADNAVVFTNANGTKIAGRIEPFVGAEAMQSRKPLMRSQRLKVKRRPKA